MSDGTPLFGGLHIDLTDSDPVLFTVHPDGELSVCMTGEQGSLRLYLTGTPDELHALADTLWAIVTAHESTTTLAGEAARTVAINLDNPAFLVWCIERGHDLSKLSDRGAGALYVDWLDNHAGVTS